jgi:hypothetical protein
VVTWRVGLWEWVLLKDTIILTGVVLFPRTFRSFSFKSGGELDHRLARDKLGVTAVLAFYLDAAPVPPVGGLTFEGLATFLVMRPPAALRERNGLQPSACAMFFSVGWVSS